MWRLLCVCVLCLAGALVPAQKDPAFLAMPTSGFVIDNAHLLNLATVAKINKISSSARAPIYVVTIPSLASVKAFSADGYAKWLMNLWARDDRSPNARVLLLVSKQDRQARIEIGQSWGSKIDSQCEGIMDGWIIPAFKDEDYSKGILDGVAAMDTLLRTGKAPTPPFPLWASLVLAGLGSFFLLCVIDYARKRRRGWAWRLFQTLSATSPSGSNSYTSSSSSSSSGGSSNSGSNGGASGSW